VIGHLAHPAVTPGATRVEGAAAAAERAEFELAAQWACALIDGRQTILPKRLADPGPDAQQLEQILGAAAAAPDHGERRPWRFVIIPRQARSRLAQVFGGALLERDAGATGEQLEQAREKAHRAPLLLLAIARLAGDDGEDVPEHERLISAGCAIQNMLLVATALGFGSALTSGKAMQSVALRNLFALDLHERALCFISIGTPTARKSRPKRPDPVDYVSVLRDDA
jgi:nitroreductase